MGRRTGVGAARRRAIERLFEGRWADSGFGELLMWPGDRVLVARRALAVADLWPCPDPRHLAAELGFRVCACNPRGCGGETTDGCTIFYRWCPDRRERGLLLAHGLSHAVLMREGWRHSEADAWWLTGDLVLAGALRSLSVDDAARQAHAPDWFVRAFAANARVEVLPLREQIESARRAV